MAQTARSTNESSRHCCGQRAQRDGGHTTTPLISNISNCCSNMHACIVHKRRRAAACCNTRRWMRQSEAAELVASHVFMAGSACRAHKPQITHCFTCALLPKLPPHQLLHQPALRQAGIQSHAEPVLTISCPAVLVAACPLRQHNLERNLLKRRVTAQPRML
jgi:hypothetical protein